MNERTDMAIAKVAVVQTEVFGAVAFHADCLECEWRGKRRDRQAQALADAKRHGATHVSGGEQ